MKRSDLLIVGTGAMACLFAARFSMAGIPVMMLGSWPAGVKALSQNGVKLVEPDGCEFNTPVSISADPLDCTGMRLGLILVKSWQTERAAQQLSTCLGQDGLVLTLQNGVGNREILVQHLGSQRVAVGSTTSGATLLAPGVVRAAGEGVITLGIHAQLAPLSDLLGKAGFVVETVSDIQSIQWGKLVINAAINPLTAILGVSNGELLKRPSSRSLLSDRKSVV